MSLEATITLAVTGIVALAGFLVTYVSNRRLAEREARLERINNQLSELYGPLLAELEAGNAAWNVFQEVAARLGPKFWKTGVAPNDEQAPLWRMWIQTVLQPRNRRMTDRVKLHADLLLEDEMPECLVKLGANTAAYEVLVARWEDPHFAPQGREDHLAPIGYSFPRDELEAYVPSSFRTLKKAQQDLLGELGRMATQ